MTITSIASPSSIVLDHINAKGVYSTGPSPDLAQLISSLLKKNHQDFHVFFNDNGFHNHIVHHMLSLYALNADSNTVRKSFERDASYQRLLPPADSKIVADMQQSRDSILEYLSGDENQISSREVFNGKQYPNFLEFWKHAIEEHGIKGIVDEWIFKGDEVGEKIFGRLLSGLIHPFIHLGFALEFHQPAILAEALAQACVHENYMYPFLEACSANATKLKANNTTPRNLVDLLQEIQDNDKIRTAPRYEDGNKLRQGVLDRISPELIDVASQWFVPSDSTSSKPASWDTINEKIAEHIHASFLFTSTAAFHTSTKPDGKKIHHQPKLDFFLVHDTNASIFLTAFAQDKTLRDTLGPQNIIRLLEAKTRIDLANYIARGSPAITAEKLDHIRNYKTHVTTDRDFDRGWDRVFERIINLRNDDSHAVKFIRALANAERVCQAYEDREWCVIKGDMWLRMGCMAADSFETEPIFVRQTGWDQAWVGVPEWNLASHL